MNKDDRKEKLLSEIEGLRRAPMPRIYDNIEQSLPPALQETLNVSNRADCSVATKMLKKSFVHCLSCKGDNGR
jgi:hypothetical protein